MGLDLNTSNIVNSNYSSMNYAKKANDIDKIKNSIENKSSDEDDKALKEMCQQFEKYFMSEMNKAMKKTVNYKNFVMYGGQSEEIFSDMLDEQYVDAAAKSGSFGLAKKLYNQLKSPTSATGSAIINKGNEEKDSIEKETSIKTEDIKE